MCKDLQTLVRVCVSSVILNMKLDEKKPMAHGSSSIEYIKIDYFIFSLDVFSALLFNYFTLVF